MSFQKQLFLDLQGAGESPGDLVEMQIRIRSVWGLTSNPLVLEHSGDAGAHESQGP